ncbi:Protein of unknown function [Micromonospora lupini str. Lupac 08]|uniref:Uncharacterized protein n=1 Tax=Micromonospora lupini str. Lupac 08 TaxID=1150864 RepID=I0KX22_9ACTN|nr:Protein of unknown function [Micromonospora lupini str. Lupac 08]
MVILSLANARDPYNVPAVGGVTRPASVAEVPDQELARVRERRGLILPTE